MHWKECIVGTPQCILYIHTYIYMLIPIGTPQIEKFDSLSLAFSFFYSSPFSHHKCLHHFVMLFFLKVVDNQVAAQSFTWDSQPLPAYQYFENVRNFLVAAEELKLPAFEASDLERVCYLYACTFSINKSNLEAFDFR